MVSLQFQNVINGSGRKKTFLYSNPDPVFGQTKGSKVKSLHFYERFLPGPGFWVFWILVGFENVSSELIIISFDLQFELDPVSDS